jgi:hypothetical protein
MPIERYVARSISGTPIVTLRELSQHDAVMASMAAGDPIGADDFILGPVGPGGYPKQLWNRVTGAIDHEVAEYWREHGDLLFFARTHWSEIGPDLEDKLHVYIGEMDVFYRNFGVHQLEDFIKSSSNPHVEATFSYGTLSSGWQPMTNAELVRMMGEHVARHAPKGTDLSWKQD